MASSTLVPSFIQPPPPSLPDTSRSTGEQLVVNSNGHLHAPPNPPASMMFGGGSYITPTHHLNGSLAVVHPTSYVPSRPTATILTNIDEPNITLLRPINIEMMHHESGCVASPTPSSASAHAPVAVESFASGSGMSVSSGDLGGYQSSQSMLSIATENGHMTTGDGRYLGLILIRLLMSGKEVGSIIGKRGENVKKYREESGARINISDGSSPERIVTITGTTEQIYVSFTMMSQKFEDDFTQSLLKKSEDSVPCPPVTLRLLVPASQCGSIIGKGGSRIKDVRELTGVSIQVASEALPASNERTVTISGTAKAIAKCIRQLCDIFLESPAKGPMIFYRPKPSFNGSTLHCPGSTYANGLMGSFPMQGSETGSDHATNFLLHHQPGHMPNGESSVSPATITLSPQHQQHFANQLSGMSAPHQPYAMDATSAAAKLSYSIHQLASNASNCSPTGSSRTGLLQDISTDPTQYNPLFNCNDLAALQNHHNPLLMQQSLHSMNPTLACGLATPLLSPTSPFPYPDLALSSGLFGLQALQALPQMIPENQGLLFPNASDGLTSSMGTSIAQTTLAKSNMATINSTSNNNGLVHSLRGGQNSSQMEIDRNQQSLQQQSQEQLINFLCCQPNKPFWSLSTTNGSPIAPSTENLGTLYGASPILTSNLPMTPYHLSPPSPSSAHLLLPPELLNQTTLGDQQQPVCHELVLSNELIGCIIGRGGTTINEIRTASKAQIKISNCEDATKQRKITLYGTQEAVSIACILMNNRIATELMAGLFAIASN